MPALTAVVAGTLAIGIGSTTAIFSVVHGTLLRPLPFREPDRLVVVSSEFPSMRLRGMGLSAPEGLELSLFTRAYEHVGLVTFGTATVTGREEPVRAIAAFATSTLFDALGVPPRSGRWFSRDDDRPGAPPVAALGHGLWLRAFGGDLSVVGRSVLVNGAPRTIVGIAPPAFDLFDAGADVWLPAAIDPGANRSDHMYRVVARLAPGIGLAGARQELAAAVDRWREETGELHAPARFHPLALAPLHETTIGSVRQAMVTLGGAVLFVLLVACANVANLLLARAEDRRHERAVRLALGASRLQLLRGALAETIVLAGLGGAAGLLLAWGGVSALKALEPPGVPRLQEIAIDRWVLLYTAGASLATGLVFALLPLSRPETAQARRTLTVGTDRYRSGLLVAELAVSVTLLAAAALMMRSVGNLTHVDPGFATAGLMRMSVALPARTYPTVPQVAQFFETLTGSLRGLPAVDEAAVMMGLPPMRAPNNTTVFIDDGPTDVHDLSPVEFVQFVSPSFFEALRIPVLQGRAFTAADRENTAPVAIINETMARTFFGGRPAVGRKVRFGMPGAPWLSVVGVVRDVHQKGLHQPAGSELYAPHRQVSNVWSSFVPRDLNVVIRVAQGQDPASLAGAMRREVTRLDPGLAVAGLQTMDAVMRRSVAQPRFLATVLGTFAAVALVLAAVGVYGAVSYGVAQRMPEFAVRVALGATPRDVLSLALRQGLRATAGGLLLGVAGALGAGRLLTTWMFQLAPTDGLTLAAVASLLGGVAAIACVLPARRATQVDPAPLLRG